MKAFVYVQDFGSDQQKRGLCASILACTGVAATIGEAPHVAGVVVVECTVSGLGKILAELARDPATNWVEYTVQFDA